MSRRPPRASKGENSVKLFGNDSQALEKTADKIKDVMETVPGITDLAVFNSLGQPTVRIDIDRARAARYGLQPGDINATMQAAIGGQAAGNLYEDGSDRNFPIVVRLAPKYRESLDAIRRITIGAPNPNGNGVVPIPLTDVADGQARLRRLLHLSRGPGALHPDQVQRARPRSRRRGAGGAAEDRQTGAAAAAAIASNGSASSASCRTRSAACVVVPLSLGLICVLLFVNFGSLTDMLLAASVMPMALIGGIFALCSDRHAVQRVGGDRLCRAVRHRGDGRHHRHLLLQPADRSTAWSAPRPSCAPARCRCGRW